jgi:hypothetical protein
MLRGHGHQESPQVVQPDAGEAVVATMTEMSEQLPDYTYGQSDRPMRQTSRYRFLEQEQSILERK